MIRLEKKYQISGTVGDQVSCLIIGCEEVRTVAMFQDWLTLLGWETGELFYPLPCQFNRQTDRIYKTDYWLELFNIYHHCDQTALIIHNNGEGW